MVTFVNEMYGSKFKPSLQAKKQYARHHGYEFDIFNEQTLDCGKFREVRWRGDLRYCKIRALMVVGARIKDLKSKDEEQIADYLFWHDADTHIMEPNIPLERFIYAAGDKPVIFTENALSLNNGVFFLEYSDRGRAFFKGWAKVCRKGEWPWADNGCMYEAMLQMTHGDKYSGTCKQYRERYDPQRPEPPTGKELMKCFNDEMSKLGTGCCGNKVRQMDDVSFLTGTESFNHNPCDELKKHYSDEPIEVIEAHCWKEGMFLVHSKSDYYVKESLQKAKKALGNVETDEL